MIYEARCRCEDEGVNYCDKLKSKSNTIDEFKKEFHRISSVKRKNLHRVFDDDNGDDDLLNTCFPSL